jgi:hypothetical protein
MNSRIWGASALRLTLATGLVAVQLAAVQPAAAAELQQDRMGMANQASAFAGARLRVPLGGGTDKPRAALALTSTLRSGATGELRFAKGTEVGFSGHEKTISLTFGGKRLSQLAPGGKARDGQKLGVSTLGWVAIGVGAVAVIVVAAAAICINDSDCIPSE